VDPPVTDQAPAKVETGTEVASSQNPNRLYQLADLKKATVTLGDRSVSAWVMDDPGKRQEGMMYLTKEEAGPDAAMLFVFPQPQESGRGFWMQNTLIPLDIVYLSPKGEVVWIAEGKPKDETNLPSPAEFQYVLELPKGKAKAYGIEPGTSVGIPKDLVGDAT
jgi:uncharacterized membrane protein (UPF0127 family)